MPDLGEGREPYLRVVPEDGGPQSLGHQPPAAVSELCCLLAGGREAPLRQLPLAFTQAPSQCWKCLPCASVEHSVEGREKG